MPIKGISIDWVKNFCVKDEWRWWGGSKPIITSEWGIFRRILFLSQIFGFLGNDVNRRHDWCGLNEELLWWDYGLINVWLFWVGREYHGCFKVIGAAWTVLVLCFQRQQPRKVQSCMGKDRQSYKRLDRFMSFGKSYVMLHNAHPLK